MLHRRCSTCRRTNLGEGCWSVPVSVSQHATLPIPRRRGEPGSILSPCKRAPRERDSRRIQGRRPCHLARLSSGSCPRRGSVLAVRLPGIIAGSAPLRSQNFSFPVHLLDNYPSHISPLPFTPLQHPMGIGVKKGKARDTSKMLTSDLEREGRKTIRAFFPPECSQDAAVKLAQNSAARKANEHGA
jgi:hypothetical protein